jgi:hypothetical protein
MPGGRLVRVPRPTVATTSVWVGGVTVALAGLAVLVVTPHVVGPKQAFSRPTKFELDQMNAARAAASEGPRNHRGGRGRRLTRSGSFTGTGGAGSDRDPDGDGRGTGRLARTGRRLEGVGLVSDGGHGARV